MRNSLCFLLIAGFLGMWIGGCASTRNDRISGQDSPSRLWLDDLAFHENENEIPPDWSVFDISEESFYEMDRNWDEIQEDLFDIAK